jgi:glycosyltransferase involved in cell wall biosynthesis
MAANIKISIIIPTYNAALTVQKCIESVVTQTYKNIEIIIADGSSTDDTIKIINDFKKQYSFIKLISEKDKGIYDAMNKGIGMAQGDWLFFLGSDDTFANTDVLKNIFETNFNIIENADFIYGNVNWGNTGEVYAGEFDLIKLYKQNICHQAVFYKKEIFSTIGKYNLAYPLYADWDLNCKCFLNNNLKKIYIPNIICNYALTGSSSSGGDSFEQDKKQLYTAEIKHSNFKKRCILKIAILPRGGFIKDTKFYFFKHLYTLFSKFSKT